MYYSQDKLKSLREEHSELSNYDAWVACGRPCKAQAWPADDHTEDTESVWPALPSILAGARRGSVKSRGSGNVMNRVAQKRRRNSRKGY